MKPILCIAGPTASGKSAFAVKLAKVMDGAVINADSMQVYRDISVLSARPTEEEMAGVPHHMFGHIAGNVQYSTGEWVREVVPTILDCLARGQTPILTGGTGLYFKALFEGLADIPAVDASVQHKVEALLEHDGIAKLRELCFAVDPIAAARILGDDPQRLMRIYAVHQQTGIPLSDWQSQTRPLIPASAARFAVLLPDRDLLYGKINRRFDQMVELGGVEEARFVMSKNAGKPQSTPMFKAIGLSHLIKYLSGEMTYDRAIELAKRDSRRLAKRQMTWFRNQTPDWTKLRDLTDRNRFMKAVKDLNFPD